MALLAQIGVTPQIMPPFIDEVLIKGELPLVRAKRLAQAKALSINMQGQFILAADTVSACGRDILPKAGNEDEVYQCLKRLSGRRHRVITALALVRPDLKICVRAVITTLSFKRLSSEEIDWYVQSDEGINKSGGYAIQGRAECFVRFISGSYSNVVGLPLAETAMLLNGNGFNLYQRK